MVDYNKLNKPDLEAQLKERNLPHTGKKAELIARLQADDQEKAAVSNPVVAAEDEIDWDEDADKSKPEAPVEPKPEAPLAAKAAKTGNASTDAISDPPKAQTTTNTTTTATANTTATAAAVPAPTTEADTDADADTNKQAEREKTPVDFSIGLEKISLDEELEKRRARAKRFGIEESDPDAKEALARLERAKKFDAENVPSLNEALSTEGHHRKRGREGGDGRSGGHKYRGGGRQQRGGFHGSRHRGPGRDGQQRREGGGGGGGGGGGIRREGWSEADKAAAESRKARFNT